MAKVRALGKTILLTMGIVMLGTGLGILLLPRTTLGIIDKAGIKGVLVLLAEAFLGVLGWLIYTHDSKPPSPRKMLARIISAVVIVGTVVTGGPLALGAASVVVSPEEVAVDVSFRSVGISSAASFAVMVSGLIMLYRLYLPRRRAPEAA